MGFDDLLRDAETETGMGAEFLAFRSLAVEALEDGGELVRWNAGSLVIDNDRHQLAVAPCRQHDCASGRTKGDRIADEIAQDLAEPPFHAEDTQVFLCR